jgi:DNA-binding transcriptional MerR regulator
MGIRAMCEAFDVTPRALRFYEQKELLFPIREGQKRLYTRRDRARLKLILRGKRYGVSLEEIRQVLDLYGTEGHETAQIARSLELARRRRAEMSAQRDELDSAIAELDEQIARGEEYMAREGSQTAA